MRRAALCLDLNPNFGAKTTRKPLKNRVTENGKALDGNAEKVGSDSHDIMTW